MTGDWKNRKLYIRLDLRFFDESEKTEKATPRKKSKAREQGQVAKSNEVNTAFTFLGCFFLLSIIGGSFYRSVMNLITYTIMLTYDYENVVNVDFAPRLGTYIGVQILLIAMPVFAVSMLIGIITNLLQVGWKITGKPMRPKFSKINPMKGFKRIFSVRSLIEFGKSLLKLIIIGTVVYNLVLDEKDTLFLLLDMELFAAIAKIMGIIVNLGIVVGGWFILIAVLDFAYARWKHAKDLKMTKQEIKDEYKMTEGNPQIKSRIRAKMRELSLRRMMQAIPEADVIITNPTHYAVALRYNKEKEAAPVVVAKGVDHLAKRIRELAAQHDVQTVENKELARALYHSVDIGREIPPELYQAVAEVLAFVYKLKNKDNIAS